MKRLIYGLIVIVLLTQAVEAQKKSDREIDGLIGSVKTICHYRAEVVHKDDVWLEKAKEFTGCIYFERDGTNLAKTEGNSLLFCLQNVKIEITNDDKGNRIKTYFISNFFTKTYSGKWVYLYDSNERLIEHRMCDSADEITSRMVKTYNELGAEIEWAYFNGQGILEQTITYTHKEFDSKGNWIKRVEVNRNQISGRESRSVQYRTHSYYP